MSYKENKHYKRYTKKHKDVKEGVETLESFCNDDYSEMEVFGSLVRKDYYYGKSDCDALFITHNIDKTTANFENYIASNSFLKLRRKKLVYYGLDKNKVDCSGMLFQLYVKNCKFDVVIVNKKDYQNYTNLIIPIHNILFSIIMAIIKFFYYQIPIIPTTIYTNCKRLLFKRRLHIVKEEKYSE